MQFMKRLYCTQRKDQSMQKICDDKLWLMEEELNEVVVYKNSLLIIRVFEKKPFPLQIWK